MSLSMSCPSPCLFLLFTDRSSVLVACVPARLLLTCFILSPVWLCLCLPLPPHLPCISTVSPALLPVFPKPISSFSHLSFPTCASVQRRLSSALVTCSGRLLWFVELVPLLQFCCSAFDVFLSNRSEHLRKNVLALFFALLIHSLSIGATQS